MHYLEIKNKLVKCVLWLIQLAHVYTLHCPHVLSKILNSILFTISNKKTLHKSPRKPAVIIMSYMRTHTVIITTQHYIPFLSTIQLLRKEEK